MGQRWRCSAAGRPPCRERWAQLREEQPDWPVIGLWPDLTDYAAVERAVQEVAQTFGGVDILVNNAGISAREPWRIIRPRRSGASWI